MFDAELLDHAIDEILDLKPNLVAVVGDLTSEGYGPQFRQAKRYLDRLSGLELLVIPGNHDLMNVGFLHFRDAFAKSDRVVRPSLTPPDGCEPQRWATLVAANSSIPAPAEGEVGLIRYHWTRARYELPDD